MSMTKRIKALSTILLICLFLLPVNALANNEDVDTQASYQPGDVVSVKRGTFVITREQAPDLYLPKQDVLFFEHGNASLESIEVRHGDFVRQGDVLMTFTRHEELAATESRRLRHEQAIRDSEQTTKELQEQIRDLRQWQSTSSDTHERQTIALDIQIVEENLRWHKIQSEKNILAIEEEILEATEDMAVETLVAPFDGQVFDITGRRAGDRLNNWEYMCRIVSQEPFLLEMSNSNNEYRQGSTVTIQHGPAKDRQTMTARVVADHSLLEPELVMQTAWLEIEGINPLEAVQAINPLVSAQLQRVEDVLLVPRRAVIRVNQEYYVNFRTDSGMVRRYVQVVNWNSDYYWIEDGLVEGDELVIE